MGVHVLLLPPGTFTCLSQVDVVSPGLFWGAQSTFASALARVQNGNWMPVVSVLDECPTCLTAVGTGFLLLSLSPLFLHPYELCGCAEGCNSGL